MCNLRKNGKRGSAGLKPDPNLLAPHFDLTFPPASNPLVPQTDCLAYLSARYRRLDLLESQETLLAINKRVNLAAMAQYRESLVPKVVGGNRARDANLKLFGAIIPHHSAIERPEDKAANAAASQDWLTLRDRLGAGMTWLQRRDLFSGNGAFLALPPQSVPDSYVSRITAKNFGPLLDLLDVAWRALDGGARRTMDALVRCALTGQPLAEAALALERSEGRISADQAGLLPILAARSVSDYATSRRTDSAAADAAEPGVEGVVSAPEAVRSPPAATRGEDVIANASQACGGPRCRLSMISYSRIFLDEQLSQQI